VPLEQRAPPFPPIRRDIGRLLSNPLLGVPPPKGSAASAPPNIGGVSEGRGGFAALRIPHAYSFTTIPNGSFIFYLSDYIRYKYKKVKRH